MLNFTILFISVLLISSLTAANNVPSRDIFSQDSYPPLFEEDLEAESTEFKNEYSLFGSNTPSASVTYDKRQYLGDMIRDYFSKNPTPENEGNTRVNSTKPMAGYGKIDISIQYGCCANHQTETTTEESLPEEKPVDEVIPEENPVEQPIQEQQLKQIGEITIYKKAEKESTSRFENPSPAMFGQYAGFGPDENVSYLTRYSPTMYQPKSAPQGYMRYVDDYKDDKLDSKRFYHQDGVSVDNYPLADSYTAQYKATTNPPMYYSSPSQSYTNKRYSYRYDDVTTRKPTTPIPKSKDYNHNSRRYDSSPMLVTKEQFYSVQSPSFSATTPTNPEQGRSVAIPADLYHSYGGYMGPQPPTVGPPMQVSHYFPGEGSSGSSAPTSVPNFSAVSGSTPPMASPTASFSYYGNHVTPRSILQDISKIVIQDVPSRMVYSGQMAQEPQMQEKQYQTYYNPPGQQPTKSANNKSVTNQNYYQQASNSYQTHQEPQNSYQQASNSYQTHQAPQNSYQTHQAPQNSYQQASNSYQTQQTPQNSYQQASNSYQAHQAPQNSYQQPSSSYQTQQTPQNSYQQASNSYQAHQAPQNSYQQPSNSYQAHQSPQNSYQQSLNGYQTQQSSQTSYQEPSNGYQKQQKRQNSYQQSSDQSLQNNNNLNGPQTKDFQESSYFEARDNFEYLQTQIPALPIQSNATEDLIKKKRPLFLKLKHQSYDFFTKAALNDFKQLLAKNIESKGLEVLPEEKNMLDLNIESQQELSANILDYLTVYERYSDLLNNTELASHLLQDMDRAKEYLSMKLNKFWLELDAMETSDDFEDKKNYYKNREKPTGIMNIFYDWYEKMVTNSGPIDQDKIKLKLIEIMKKERRYWLLLLKS